MLLQDQRSRDRESSAQASAMDITQEQRQPLTSDVFHGHSMLNLVAQTGLAYTAAVFAFLSHHEGSSRLQSSPPLAPAEKEGERESLCRPGTTRVH